MTKQITELNKELEALDQKFKTLDIKFGDVWKNLENRLEKSMSDMDGLDKELRGMLANLAVELAQGGVSQLLESGMMNELLTPLLQQGNEWLSFLSPDGGGSGDNAFGLSTSQLLGDLSKGLQKISRNF